MCYRPPNTVLIYFYEYFKQNSLNERIMERSNVCPHVVSQKLVSRFQLNLLLNGLHQNCQVNLILVQNNACFT
jgi:hypothetical protein